MRFPPTSSLAKSGALALAILASACGQGEPTPLFAPTDPAGRLFDPNHVVEVSIEMAPADWDAMRMQTRTWWDVVARYNKQCLNEPIPKPFTYFPADITVDGTRLNRVGIHKKGYLGSLDTEKPALKVRFDHYVTDQRLLGLSRLTLNNSKQDPSYVKQCLSYGVFQAVGVATPWCNFAHVSVNGKDLGLYVHLESMDRHFVRRHFEGPEGDLWEGEVSDFRTDWVKTFEKKGDLEDGDQTTVDRSTLSKVARVVETTTKGSAMIRELEPLIDLDEFLTFWAAEKVLEHWDGYANNTNNFFVYQHPQTDKFVFVPAGTDQIAVVDPYTINKPPVSVYATGALCWRLYGAAESRPLYIAKLREVLDRGWDETHLLSEIDRMRAVILPVLSASGADLSAVESSLEDLRGFVRGRRKVILDDIQGGARAWEQPLKNPPCVDRSGDAEGSFVTTYGTSGRDAFASGWGGLDVKYRGLTVPFRRVGATSGKDLDDPQNLWPRVDMSAEGVNGNWYSCWITVRPDLFKPGAVIVLGDVGASGGMGVWNPVTRQWTFMGSLMNGTLRLDQAKAENGAPVSGSFKAWLISWD